MEYQQIAAAFFFLLLQYGPFGVLERWVGVGGGLVFGTLLGPEATGPGFCPGLFVSGFLAAPITHVVCVGCVVWGCCLRTT